MDDQVAAAELLATVRAAGAPLLAGAEIFDVYRGAQLGEGKVSLALHLEFRAPGRTLTDDEVAAARTGIVERLASAHGAQIRG